MNLEPKELKKKVNLALDLFYENDSQLIEDKVQERAITHRFALYLEQLFKGYDIDCEYDKHGKLTKELEGISECSLERMTDRILPDILIHKRGNDSDNLVVFEIKSKTDANDCDIRKLELMTKKNGQFNYSFGVFIKFTENRKDCKIEWYINAQKYEEKNRIQAN